MNIKIHNINISDVAYVIYYARRYSMGMTAHFLIGLFLCRYLVTASGMLTFGSVGGDSRLHADTVPWQQSGQ